VQQAASIPGLEFVAAARRGDARAWAVLFKTWQPAVTSYCLTCAGGRRDLAMDLTQEVFTLAIQRIAQLDDASRFQGWLFTIARNLWLKRHAKLAREEQATVRLSMLMTEEAPEDAAEREYWLRQVELATTSVDNPRHREVVIAHYGNGEKTRDIARRLDVPHGTVTVVLMRFRESLKKSLLSTLAEEPHGA
jgi:RNA polymerase sigma-70 factor (ECF subfamily)